jgi:hypothetical protein
MLYYFVDTFNINLLASYIKNTINYLAFKERILVYSLQIHAMDALYCTLGQF